MSKLSQFFQENNGNYSATRLAFLAWIFGALIIWSIGSFRDKEMQPIPESVTILVGVLMSGKVAQKFQEESGSLPTNSNVDQPSSGLTARKPIESTNAVERN